MSDGTTRRPARCNATGFARDDVLRALEDGTASLAPGGTGLMGTLTVRVMENVASSAAQPPAIVEADPYVQLGGPDAAIGADWRRLCGKAAVWPVEQQVRV